MGRTRFNFSGRDRDLRFAHTDLLIERDLDMTEQRQHHTRSIDPPRDVSAWGHRFKHRGLLRSFVLKSIWAQVDRHSDSLILPRVP